MFLQEAVVKLLALDLPCLTPGSVSSIVITRSSGDDALDASIKAAIQASAPTQCHRILMQDEKREALPLLSEHNNFVRVTCFK